MTSLATAKILLFIALSLGPKEAPTVFATSNSDNYAWTRLGGSWSLKTKGLPACDWTQRGDQQASGGEQEMRAIAHHRWSEGQFLNLEDGNRIEQQGKAIFYIVDPGAPNEKVYTILFPRQQD